jgi:hypothetical protein
MNDENQPSVDVIEHEGFRGFIDARIYDLKHLKPLDVALGIFIITGAVEAYRERNDPVGCAKGLGKLATGVIAGNTIVR